MKQRKGKAILLSILLTITMLFSGVTGFATTIIPGVGSGNEEALEIDFAAQVDVNSISGKNYDLTIHYEEGNSDVEVTFTNLQTGVDNAFKYSFSSGNTWIDYTGPFSIPITTTQFNVKLLSPTGSPNGELLMHATLSFEEILPPTPEYTIDTVVMTDGIVDSAGGTATGDGTYDENTEVDLIAAANEGYEFIGWYTSDELTDILSTDLTYGITVTGDATYYAAFETVEEPPPTPEYTIATVVVTDGEVDSASGTATGDGTYDENTEVDLIAAAKAGFEFIGWYASDKLTDVLSTDLTYGITVTEDATYYAAFEEEEIQPPVEPVAMNFFADVSGIFSEDEASFMIQRDESEEGLTFKLLYSGPVPVATVTFSVEQEALSPILESDGSWTVNGFIPGELITMNVSNVNGDFVYDYLEVDETADESLSYSFTVPEANFSSMAAFYEEEETTPGGGGGVVPITYALKVKVIGNGTVNPSVGVHRYAPGTVVDLAPSAMNGWEFFGWDGAVQADQVVMNGDRTITAIFKKIESVPLAPPTVTPPPIIILDEEVPKDDGALPNTGVEASMSNLLLGAGSILLGILNRKKK